jgi:hypothetical protein
MRFAPAAPSATPHDAAREVFRAPLDFSRIAASCRPRGMSTMMASPMLPCSSVSNHGRPRAEPPRVVPVLS